jgi:hypothetical protein
VVRLKLVENGQYAGPKSSKGDDFKSPAADATLFVIRHAEENFSNPPSGRYITEVDNVKLMIPAIIPTDFLSVNFLTNRLTTVAPGGADFRLTRADAPWKPEAE